MLDAARGRETAWLVLLLIAAANFGNFYVYDSIGPVADLLQRQRGFSDTQIGLLNAIYSLPNVVLILVGGVLVDRFGASRVMIWTAAICLVGASLTAFGPTFPTMAAGRLLFGAGAETFLISTTVGIVRYFTGGNLAFALGLTLAIGRAGSFSSDMSPAWFPGAYAQGWQAPLVIAVMFAASSFAAALAFRWIDLRSGINATVEKQGERPRLVARDLLRFGRAYWFLLVLCVLWYAVILAFRSTFSIKYFQHAHGLELAAAGAMNSYVFLAAMFATPAFGWLCDRSWSLCAAAGVRRAAAAGRDLHHGRDQPEPVDRDGAARHQLFAGSRGHVAAVEQARRRPSGSGRHWA